MGKIQNAIPGWLTPAQLDVLARLAGELPPGATVAEVGAVTGQASLQLLRSAPPEMRLTAIGAWASGASIADRPRLRDPEGGVVDCSAAAFRKRLERYSIEVIDTGKPILAIQQQKPDVLFDLVFLYEGYEEVHFEVQLDFWFGRLKTMGLLCGADFVLGFRDIAKTLLRYCNRKRAALGIEQNIWQLYNAVQP